MKLILSNNVQIPIYEQIKEQFKSAILAGEIKEGESLPSIRTLAKELKISVITTTRAYQELEQEGFVRSIQGKGCFVLSTNTEIMREKLLQEIEESILEGIKKANIAKIREEEFRGLIDVLIKEAYNE
nr:GntR family transcriptional regulator [uncultured Niameybacter sp.]